MASPYINALPNQWAAITASLVKDHPLNTRVLIDVVVTCWQAIFESRFGPKGFRIGREIFPKPQIMGFLLHELIPLDLAARYPDHWRGDTAAKDKDIVYIPDDKYSIEVKTSSHASGIFGNRSYAQPGATEGKKAKSGFYLTVNFESCTQANPDPALTLIRFGWIDSTDWIGQKAATGQQSRLPPDVQNGKLMTLYRKC